jgi:hypothetical protein
MTECMAVLQSVQVELRLVSGVARNGAQNSSLVDWEGRAVCRPEGRCRLPASPAESAVWEQVNRIRVVRPKLVLERSPWDFARS